MEQGDIIRITDVQTLDGYTKPILNVYYYQVVSLTAEVQLPVYAQELAVSFLNEVLEYVRGLQVSALKHVGISFLNMSNQAEIGDYTFEEPYPGLLTGDYVPSNVTYSFRLQRYDRLVRNGRKSISGVPDAVITAGRTLNPTYSGPVSDASLALGRFFNVEGETTDATLNPIIVRIPANPGVVPTVWSPIVRALFRGFGTQNSRKAL